MAQHKNQTMTTKKRFLERIIRKLAKIDTRKWYRVTLKINTVLLTIILLTAVTVIVELVVLVGLTNWSNPVVQFISDNYAYFLLGALSVQLVVSLITSLRHNYLIEQYETKLHSYYNNLNKKPNQDD